MIVIARSKNPTSAFAPSNCWLAVVAVNGQVALVPIRRPAICSPLLRMPADDLCYAFNLVRIPATSDANEANRLVDANKATYGRVKAAGTLYPVSAFPMSKGEWRDYFGSAFGPLDAAKQQYDPYKILTPGYEIF